MNLMNYKNRIILLKAKEEEVSLNSCIKTALRIMKASRSQSKVQKVLKTSI